MHFEGAIPDRWATTDIEHSGATVVRVCSVCVAGYDRETVYDGQRIGTASCHHVVGVVKDASGTELGAQGLGVPHAGLIPLHRAAERVHSTYVRLAIGVVAPGESVDFAGYPQAERLLLPAGPVPVGYRWKPDRRVLQQWADASPAAARMDAKPLSAELQFASVSGQVANVIGTIRVRLTLEGEKVTVPLTVGARIDTRSGEATPFLYRPPQLPRDDFSIRAVALGCGGEQLLALGDDMGFYVFRTADMTPVRLCYDDLSVPQNAACAFSPDGRFAACVTSRPGDRWDTLGSGVLILDVRRATKAHQLTTPDGSGVSSLTFTSDSDSLVAGTCSGRVLQWSNAGSLMGERRPEAPHVSATLVAWTPDSDVITAAYLTPSNESVRVDHWDAYAPGGPRSSRTFTMPSIGK